MPFNKAVANTAFPGVGVFEVDVDEAVPVDLEAVVTRGTGGDLAGEDVPGDVEGDEEAETLAPDTDVAREEVVGEAVLVVVVLLMPVVPVAVAVGEGPRGEAVGVDPTEGGLVGRDPMVEVTERALVAEGEAGVAVGEDKADRLAVVEEAVVTVMEGRGEAVDEAAVVLGDVDGEERTLAEVALRVGTGLDVVTDEVEEVPLALEGALLVVVALAVVDVVVEAARADEGATLGPEKVDAMAEMAGETVEGERAILEREAEEALTAALAGE